MFALNPPRQHGQPATSFRPGPIPHFRLPRTSNGFQFSYYRPLDMTPRFEARCVHDSCTATDSITMPAKATMKEIWNELYRASRQSRTYFSILSFGIERRFSYCKKPQLRQDSATWLLRKSPGQTPRVLQSGIREMSAWALSSR
jgi:hypothetical protein